jgi:transcriptional regulator with XRE-family HTH domain
MVNIDKIKDLAKEKGLSITFICQAVGQGPYYLNDVKRRNGSIPEERLKTIADTLGTTVEYLTDQTEQKEKPAETEVDLDKLMEDILNLPRDKKEKLAVLFMEMLKNTK